MLKKCFNKISSYILIALFFLLFFSICVNAQTVDCSDIGEDKKEPYPEQIREKLTEMCIEKAKKDFQELIESGEEIAKLTEELEISYDKSRGFTSDDREKMERVEDLLKKIRKELRADDDDDDLDEKKNRPKNISEAVKNLKEKTSDLCEELKKTSRYSISAAAVQNSNVVLRLLRFIQVKN